MSSSLQQRCWYGPDGPAPGVCLKPFALVPTMMAGAHSEGTMMFGFTSPFDTSGFMPRWDCGAWTPFLGWLHIGFRSDRYRHRHPARTARSRARTVLHDQRGGERDRPRSGHLSADCRAAPRSPGDCERGGARDDHACDTPRPGHHDRQPPVRVNDRSAVVQAQNRLSGPLVTRCRPVACP